MFSDNKFGSYDIKSKLFALLKKLDTVQERTNILSLNDVQSLLKICIEDFNLKISSSLFERLENSIFMQHSQISLN